MPALLQELLLLLGSVCVCIFVSIIFCCLLFEVIVIIKQTNLTWTSGRWECMSIKQEILILEEFICKTGKLNIVPMCCCHLLPCPLTLFRTYHYDLKELRWVWHLFLSKLISQNRTLEFFWAPFVYFIFYFFLDLLPSWMLYRNDNSRMRESNVPRPSSTKWA